METWQKEHIRANLVDLLSFTDCNATLIAYLRAQNCLELADVDILETVRKSEGQLDQSTRLYGLLETRQGGYENIIKALIECRQTGALEILLKGYVNQGIDNVLEICDIPIDFNAIMSCTVNFQGQTGPLSDLSGIAIETLQEIMKDTACQADYINMFIVRNENLILLKNTIPPPPKFYLERSICNPNLQLDPEIFKQECEDVFVFIGIERPKLTELAYPNLTATSIEQIYELTSRFILLGSIVDWQELQSQAFEKSCAAHLIRCENKSNDQLDGQGFNDWLSSHVFILEGTTGNSEILSRYVKASPGNSHDYLSEDKIVESLVDVHHSSGMYICGSPGIGKSCLLASLARKILNIRPKAIVAFIPFPDFIYILLEKFTDTDITKDESLKLVLKYISPTSLSAAVLLQAIIINSCSLELFIDGLDQISTEHMTLTMRFLKSFLSSGINVHLFVASRPKLRKELESILGLVAYDMLPFSEANQLEYLQLKWRELNPGSSVSKLEMFSRACLINARCSLTECELKFLVYPMQLDEVAKAYTDEASLYSNPKRNQDVPIFKSNSLEQLRKALAEINVEDYKLSNDSKDYVNCPT